MTKAPKSAAGKRGKVKAAPRRNGKAATPAAKPEKTPKSEQPKPGKAPKPGPEVLDQLWSVVMQRRSADPAISHSARLLSRGTAKVAQKFGEEAVECLIEAVAKNPVALVGESADVLYHLIVMWVAAGVEPLEVWAELHRRQGISGVEEKAARPKAKTMGTTKIP